MLIYVVARWIESQDLATGISQMARHGEMVTPAVEGIDLFKIADRSISGWITSFKTNAASPIRQPSRLFDLTPVPAWPWSRKVMFSIM